MGITRLLIIGVAALILAPMPPQDDNADRGGQAAGELQTHQLVSVATGTFTDVSSFCERQPLTCRAMNDIAAIAQAKAKYAFQLAYEWASKTDSADHAEPSLLDDSLPLPGPYRATDDDPEPGVPGLQSIPDILNTTLRHDPVVTGTIRKVAEADLGTNTLRIDDLLPDWRGPQPSQQT